MEAIYARQSVDRADSISIESQIELCQYEARGEAVKTYIDRGYSGKNTERPAFREMMADMERGLIRKVIVYKLDRISRSILDFSAMMDIFGKYGVEFVSTTEKFDTSSPMGRAMLNICIVFAQLERETIQKRVADAYFARCQKGLYMGGRVPFGYRLAPTVIGGIRSSMYEAVPEEAEVVRLIYEHYAQPQCSYGDIIRELHAQGICKRGKPWERSRMSDILRNPIYVRADLSVYRFYQELGITIANGPADFIGTNGCYFYHTKDGIGRNQPGPTEGCLVLAPHTGIVPADIWLQCRRKCQNAQRVQPWQKAKNTWLAGKVKCGVCGYALVSKHAPGSSRGYLLCSHRMDTKACPGPGTVRTEELEGLVYHELAEKSALLPQLHPRPAPAASPENVELRLELAQIDHEIDALMARLGEADSALFHYINQRVSNLDGRKQAIRQKLAQGRPGDEPARPMLNSWFSLWDALSFEHKRHTADLLIRAIRVDAGRIRIEWRV